MFFADDKDKTIEHNVKKTQDILEKKCYNISIVSRYIFIFIHIF